jgi:hypothetical protein
VDTDYEEKKKQMG